MAATSFDPNCFHNLPKDPDLRGAKLRDLLGALFQANLSSYKGGTPLCKAIDSALKRRATTFSAFVFAIVDALNKQKEGKLARSLFAEGRGHWFFRSHTADGELLLRLIPTSELRGPELVEAIEQLWRLVLQSFNLELIQQLPSAFHLALSSRKWLPSQWTAPIQRTLALLIRGEQVAPSSSTSLLFLSPNRLSDRMAQELLPPSFRGAQERHSSPP